VVGLEPRRLEGGQRERGRMSLAEPEGREGLEHLPHLVDERDVVAAGQRQRAEPQLHLGLGLG